MPPKPTMSSLGPSIVLAGRITAPASRADASRTRVVSARATASSGSIGRRTEEPAGWVEALTALTGRPSGFGFVQRARRLVVTAAEVLGLPDGLGAGEAALLAVAVDGH